MWQIQLKLLSVQRLCFRSILTNNSKVSVFVFPYTQIIATNQRVVAAKRQQRGLVAVTIRGSELFCSIHLLYEGLISVLSTESSGIYTESRRSN